MVDAYHYHAQAFDANVTDEGIADYDDAYTVSTNGPFNCYKANISASPGSTALLGANSDLSEDSSTMAEACCEMTDCTYNLSNHNIAKPLHKVC